MISESNIFLSVFLPLRKGSKRVKNKNIRPFKNYKFGLTELKINQLKKLKYIFSKTYKKKRIEFIISTNCKRISRYTKKFKWIKTFKRKESLAKDDSLDKLINHVPSICSGKYIMWTHVTSPFYNEKDYLNFIKMFLKIKNNKYQSAFSADYLKKFIYVKKIGWVSHDYKRKKWPRTQKLSNSYIVNSAAFLTSRQIYLKNKDRLCNNPVPILSRVGSGFDIDDMNDFKELMKKENEKKFK
tara:strand:- start:508 stop:1230 length:723 start_codon:yes stop_codon:yes gene_type:complete